MASNPTIYYFDVKARAEPLKIALSAKGVTYNYEVVKPEQVKNLDEFPFGQAPRYKDDSVDLVQTNAILRHIGRRYDLYGQGLEQQARIDVLIEAIQDFIPKIHKAFVVDKGGDSSSAFWTSHGDPSGKQGKTGGVHFSYLDSFLKKNKGSYAVGDSFTIADAALFSLLQVMQMPQVALADKLTASYPDLMAYTKRITELPILKGYISSS